MPFFSVVIPLYNKENYIKTTLESVFNQKFLDFEVIVVDDGSTDNGVAVVQSFGATRIKLYQQSNKGASAARNFGVSQAKGQWIALLDADDIWYPTHLEELHTSISRLTDADVLSNGYHIQLNSTFTKQPSYSCSINEQAFYVDDYFACSLIDSLFWTSCIAFKKEAFEAVGGFDEALKTGQDLDLFIRFALYRKLAYNPKITVLYKSFTEHNLSKTSKLDEKYKYIKKHQEAEKHNKSLKRYLDINRFSLAIQAIQHNNLQLLNQLKTEIDLNNLGKKQRLLLQLPSGSLKALKALQKTLIKLGIYKSAF